MMLPTFSLSIAFILGLANTFVSAAPAEDGCNKFRITSPTKAGQKWFSGECYQVSYYLGLNKLDSTISVDVYNAKTNALVSNVVASEHPNKSEAVAPFNLVVPESGDYYFLVNFNNGGSCPPKKTVTFHVDFDPFADLAKCS